jgi:uncharacterized protein YcfL
MKAFIFALAMFSLSLVGCESTETETPAVDSTTVEVPTAVVDSTTPVVTDSVQ